MSTQYLERILKARVYEVARETALDLAPNLSRRLKHSVWLKREDQQPVFSFKIRGAYNRIALLTPAERKRGVITASAGNHAQGVALAAQHLGIKALIVMPVTTPAIKIAAVRALGGEILLVGDNYDAAYAHARALADRKGMALVHPYDDPDVIAGQGTIGLEILRQHGGDIDAVFVPVGGGGLIAGVALAIRQIRPEVRVIGVEPEDADAMARSLAAGRRVRLARVGTFADGVAVRQVGRETFRIAQQYVDEVLVVSNDEICAAIKDIFEDTRSIMEPSGALAVAGVKRYAGRRRTRRSQHLVAIASGANMNFDRLRHVAERAEIGERREAVLAVTIPEQTGSFRRFCGLIGKHNITEFNYRYADARQAHVFVGLQMPEGEGLSMLTGRLREAGYAVLDLTDNEMAKLHIRHLVGGPAQVDNEAIYRFEFPERPGALMHFLEHMGARWNITLFHYRNHGADFGRVLAGFQVPDSETTRFQRFLKTLDYPWTEETRNPAYGLFLA
ncbi:MAG TPA: threonine ammonia-lyase, biosynthetic [Acidiferrobacteraceae bacterium]|nr:threonine ammonia-lyase, biosynthetic [Acidiferrobacteraceae bacterium]